MERYPGLVDTKAHQTWFAQRWVAIQGESGGFKASYSDLNQFVCSSSLLAAQLTVSIEATSCFRVQFQKIGRSMAGCENEWLPVKDMRGLSLRLIIVCS